MLLVLGFLLSATNIAISFDELGVVGAADVVDKLAMTTAIVFPICIASTLAAFLLSRGLGCCKRVVRVKWCPAAVRGMAKVLIDQVDTPPPVVAPLAALPNYHLAALPNDFDVATHFEVNAASPQGDASSSVNVNPPMSPERQLAAQTQHDARETSEAARLHAAQTLRENLETRRAVAAAEAAAEAEAAAGAKAAAVAKVEAEAAANAEAEAEQAFAPRAEGHAKLPAGWRAHHSALHSATFYHHAETDTQQWDLPHEPVATKLEGHATLPAGWEARHSALHNATFYHHAETDTQQWDLPHEPVATKLGGHHAETNGIRSSGRGSSSSSSSGSGSDSGIGSGIGSGSSSDDDVEDAQLEMKAAARARAREERAELKRRKKAARWKWTPRADFPIASGLVDSLSSVSTAVEEKNPQHLLDVYSAIFAAADTDGDGSLACVIVICCCVCPPPPTPTHTRHPFPVTKSLLPHAHTTISDLRAHDAPLMLTSSCSSLPEQLKLCTCSRRAQRAQH